MNDKPTERTTHRRIELAGLALWTGFCAWAVSRVYFHCAEMGWLLPIAILSALIATDFLSGFVHWLADTYGDSSTPVLGPNFIQPFREHHDDQLAITRHDFVETNGNNCIIALPFLMASCWLPVDSENDLSLFATPFLLFIAVFGLATNQIHKWAHQEQAPFLVRILQRLRLVLPKEHHAGHHAKPFTENYCITNGWMNAPLNAICFFPVVEWLIARTTGIKARASEDHLVLPIVEKMAVESEEIVNA
jgi:plasmanylethanolamine desaturase